MNEDTYMVLRIRATSGETLDMLRPTAKDVSRQAVAEELEYEIESAPLSPKELREVDRDPATAARAQPIPLRLIEPVAAADATGAPNPADEVTWGVLVTGAIQSPRLGIGVTVAILDTGIDASHEAFEGVTLIQRDFTGEGDGDRDGHGTHVAGTIFGRTKRGVRFSVAPGVTKALIGKVIGQQRSANTAELVDAVQWAVGEGANVINMSLGFDFPSLVAQWVTDGLPADLATSRALAQYRDNVRFFDALTGFLQARGPQASTALIVAAAGNESRRQVSPQYTIEVSPPAAAEGILAVAAVQSSGPPHDRLSVAPFSNTRAAVAGPGVNVSSAKVGGGYALLSGTSMASPHVAGVAALWAERQLDRIGMVNVQALMAQLRGRTSTDRLLGAAYPDVGDGLISAPVD
jgi:subtilisin family serine protease